jgi:hypothetical protein
VLCTRAKDDESFAWLFKLLLFIGDEAIANFEGRKISPRDGLRLAEFSF